MTALLTFLLLTLAGMGLFVAGVYLLGGLPWALLAGSLASLAAAWFIRAGMVEDYQ